MLKFEITGSDGRVFPLENILTVVLNSDIDVPADSLEVVSEYKEELMKNADRITAYSNDRLVFTGQLDEVYAYKTDSGMLSRLTARSPAAALLDNEALPLTYTNPNAEFIFDRHLKPFEISCERLDKTPFCGELKIDKGMTHWMAFRNFCVNRYGTEPRITADGRAYFDGNVPCEQAVFICNDTQSDYYSRRDSLKRYKLISAVRLKLEPNRSYSGIIQNKNPDCKAIVRERYINAAADRTTLKTADEIISRGNRNSREIRLECFGERLVETGARAKIIDSEWGIQEKLCVIRTRYYLSKNREKTTVVLRKETG